RAVTRERPRRCPYRRVGLDIHRGHKRVGPVPSERAPVSLATTLSTGTEKEWPSLRTVFLNRLLLLLVLWEARAGAARPRFPQDKCQPEAGRGDNAGALGGSAKWCFVYCEANRQKTSRGSWGCRRIGWSAGASVLYRGSTDRCASARAMRREEHRAQ